MFRIKHLGLDLALDSGGHSPLLIRKAYERFNLLWENCFEKREQGNQNMLSRCYARRCYAAIDTSVIAANSKQQLKLEPPALIKLKVERDPEKLFLLFKANSQNRLVVENSTAFEDTVSRLAGARRFDYIEELLEHQKSLPQGRREGFIVRIIMLYGRARMFSQALRTFFDMHLYGCQRTVKSFNAALKVLSSTHKFDAIFSFFYHVPEEFGISLDEYSYNLVIKAFCEMGYLNSACLIMVEMEKSGTKPDVVTYTTLMSALYFSNQCEIADGLWNLMVIRKCSPNVATFNVRIQYLINKRRVWQARSWMQKMLVFGVNPDELTFNLIIKGFCLIGRLDMAKRSFNALCHCNSECKVNGKIYQTMIHYLSEGEEYDLAFKFCKDSMLKNWFPSVDTICKLLKGLMKISKDRNAKEIMMLVRGRVPPYSKDVLTMLQAILSRKASFDARIQYLIKQNKASYAWVVLQKMTVLGVKPDEVTFNLAIEGFCKNNDLHMAKKVYDEMHAYGCKPNSRIQQTLICSLCEGGELELAFNICKESILSNQFPSADSICKLLKDYSIHFAASVTLVITLLLLFSTIISSSNRQWAKIEVLGSYWCLNRSSKVIGVSFQQFGRFPLGSQGWAIISCCLDFMLWNIWKTGISGSHHRPPLSVHAPRDSGLIKLNFNGFASLTERARKRAIEQLNQVRKSFGFARFKDLLVSRTSKVFEIRASGEGPEFKFLSITWLLKVFTVALIIYFDYKAVQKRTKWVRKEKKSILWEQAHERNARRVLNLIIELKGLWVKLGQYLSTRADVLPEAYIFLLKQLQDSLPPRPLQEVCRTIERELGKPMRNVFSEFTEEPLATASIAQVHRATLNDGHQVVVKVQHADVKAIILEDLKNAKSIVDWIAWAEPQYDLNPLIDEWCKEAPRELDFNREADNTTRVSKNLSRKDDHDNKLLNFHVDVLIPKVIQSTEKVLILEYMDGIRLNDQESLNAHGIDKQKLVEEITRSYAHQIYVDGFFNGDPHPGNFLVSKEPPHKPILLDFGLTKSISNSMKQALAKMFLASAEGDHVSLLSAFAEMGLRLRLDLPEQAMEVTNTVFRATTPAKEALENMKAMANERKKNMKIIQEKMKLGKKEMKRFNPVDAFPGDAVIFFRVLNLLRGLSSMMDVRIVYLDIMRPFAEAALEGGSMLNGTVSSSHWMCDTPIHSLVEHKVRDLLLQLDKDKILGIQVCAYKDGNVIIDTAAGMLGRYDPRPVQPDTLFPVFSATKGITAGLLHWLVDKGKLNLEENVANIWSNFGCHRKDLIKVHHVLNHTSGLQNAMADVMKEEPLLMCDWNECLNRIAMSMPETEPGFQQLYHYLSFGWLCGGIVEHASGRTFQDILEEAIIHPLNIEGELYIGVPPGVESRLASLSIDMEDMRKIPMIMNQQDLPYGSELSNISELVMGLPVFFNMLATRRAVIPAANGHCSARALARYYAALAAGGKVPPAHASSEIPLGSHTHIPNFPSGQSYKSKGTQKKDVLGNPKKAKMHTEEPKDGHLKVNNKNLDHKKKIDIKDSGPAVINGGSAVINGGSTVNNIVSNGNVQNTGIFSNPKIHDAFIGRGDYEGLVLPDGKFGLGFRRFKSTDGSITSFGHSGIGGSTAFCDMKHDFAMAVTVNKMSLGGVTRSIVQLICSELGIPLPEEFSALGEKGPDMQLGLGGLDN
ncbi:hypothetical protein H6P81_009240 [Aristolochia fimbriata]|uniref:Uncharacterized protein n=1 Tax=Aristolochia fimbriata TaxID=158543 RepID=A0AAV7EME4_ARIFI|nr:hypothetical protein H6P81_009240 [Aristolochia fimbriata]